MSDTADVSRADRGQRAYSGRLHAHMTLEQVAAVFGCTREYVRQIEARALKKFKASWLRMYPDDRHPWVR